MRDRFLFRFVANGIRAGRRPARPNLILNPDSAGKTLEVCFFFIFFGFRLFCRRRRSSRAVIGGAEKSFLVGPSLPAHREWQGIIRELTSAIYARYVSS